MAVSHKRREMDIMKLMMSDYQVVMEDDGADFVVQFHGPKASLYEGGVWQVRVSLPADYPYRSPSVGFKNRLFHPNVDEISGSVCLDVINQTWSPMYELLNIFDMFLPQLLSYPNASDPLNSEAAALMLHDADKYKAKVRAYVQQFALLPSILKSRNPSTDSSSSASTAASALAATDVAASVARAPADDADEMSSLSDDDDDDDRLELDL